MGKTLSIIDWSLLLYQLFGEYISITFAKSDKFIVTDNNVTLLYSSNFSVTQSCRDKMTNMILRCVLSGLLIAYFITLSGKISVCLQMNQQIKLATV